MGYIGMPVRRKEDPSLLTGVARYVDDFHLPDCLHAAIVRSPHAHARIRVIDWAPALRIPGVHHVVTWADLQPPPEPIPMRVYPTSTIRYAEQYPLARDRVRYVGEPVAVVLADNRYLAEDATELVTVEYEPLTPVTDVGAALAPGAPALFDAIPGNVAYEFTMGGPLPDSWKGAVAVVRERFHTNRHMASPMETRGLLASYDSERDVLTVWGPTKVMYWNRRVLASMLQHPEEKIRFIEPRVGGAFGLRGEFFPEDFLIPFCAKRFGRPVKWIEDRREHLMAGAHSREQVYEAEMAAAADGTILGTRVVLYQDLGAYIRTNGTVPAVLATSVFCGPYSFPFECQVKCVLTNKTPAGTYRSPGHYESTFVRERLIDMLAARLGFDPADMRMRNLIPPEQMPYDVGTVVHGEPVVLDSGDYPRTLRASLESSGYFEVCAPQTEDDDGRTAIGIGLGCFVEKTGLGEWEYSRAELRPDGHVVLYTGGASVGQGIDTILAQIVADTIGISLDMVEVRHGDTDEVPVGNGAWASRGTIHAGNCAREVSTRLRDLIIQHAAQHLEASPADIEIADGHVYVRGAKHLATTLAQVAACAGASGIACDHTYRQRLLAYPMGVHVAKVAVDLETGQVRLLGCGVAADVGHAINPMLVQGQILGGLAQGIGGATLEHLVYSSEGQLLTCSFMDYLLPTSHEVPSTRINIVEFPSPTNPLGVKGAGECGTAGAGAAIANAVANALASAGVSASITRLPLSPEQVWRSIRAAARDATGGRRGH